MLKEPRKALAGRAFENPFPASDKCKIYEKTAHLFILSKRVSVKFSLN